LWQAEQKLPPWFRWIKCKEKIKTVALNHHFLIAHCMDTSINNCRDVEQAVNSLSAPPGPFNLGNTAYLSQESTQDRQALYSQLVHSYKWTDKVRDCSVIQVQLLTEGNSIWHSS
jgi:mediator of RNA polymerase II transcription subunit 27